MKGKRGCTETKEKLQLLQLDACHKKSFANVILYEEEAHYALNASYDESYLQRFKQY